MSRLLAAIAVTRFGLGARAGELADSSSDPCGWLEQQVTPNAAAMPKGDLASTQEVFAARMANAAMGAA